MKRAKNKVYCVSCKREKLLFETQEAADRYIKFFREEKEGMNAKMASRSYYCVFCGGYHLTSITDKSKTRWFENKNSWMIRKVDDIIKSKEDITPVVENVKNIISNEVEQLIVQGQLDDAERALNACRKKIRPFKNCDGAKYRQWLAEDGNIDVVLARVAMIRRIGKASPEEQEKFLAIYPITGEERANRTALVNFVRIRAERRSQMENSEIVENNFFRSL